MILATKEDFERAILNGEEIKKQTVFYTGELPNDSFRIGYFEPKYGVYAGMCQGKHIWVGHKDAPEELDWCDAIEWCRNYNADNDIPYHLPSKEELMLMYANISIINRSLEDNGCEPLQEDYYWSSSEYSTYRAWIQCTSNGASYGGLYNYNKTNGYYVRPVLSLQSLTILDKTL